MYSLFHVNVINVMVAQKEYLIDLNNNELHEPHQAMSRDAVRPLATTGSEVDFTKRLRCITATTGSAPSNIGFHKSIANVQCIARYRVILHGKKLNTTQSYNRS